MDFFVANRHFPNVFIVWRKPGEGNVEYVLKSISHLPLLEISSAVVAKALARLLLTLHRAHDFHSHNVCSRSSEPFHHKARLSWTTVVRAGMPDTDHCRSLCCDLRISPPTRPPLPPPSRPPRATYAIRLPHSFPVHVMLSSRLTCPSSTFEPHSTVSENTDD